VLKKMTSISLDNIFPAVTPEGYLEELGKGSYVAWDLGHDLALMLWQDQGSVIKSVSPSDLAGFGLQDDDLWNLSFQNLNRVVNNGDIKIEAVGFPGDETVVVAGPHWLASSLVLHGGLHAFISEQIGSQDLMAVVPDREMAVFFSNNCSAQLRSSVESICADIVRASRKPFGWRLFSYSTEGAQPV